MSGWRFSCFLCLRAAATPWQTFYAVGIVLTVVGFLVFGLTEAWFSRNPMVRTYLMCLLIMMAGLAGERGEAERGNGNPK